MFRIIKEIKQLDKFDIYNKERKTLIIGKINKVQKYGF